MDVEATRIFLKKYQKVKCKNHFHIPAGRIKCKFEIQIFSAF